MGLSETKSQVSFPLPEVNSLFFSIIFFFPPLHWGYPFWIPEAAGDLFCCFPRGQTGCPSSGAWRGHWCLQPSRLSCHTISFLNRDAGEPRATGNCLASLPYKLLCSSPLVPFCYNQGVLSTGEYQSSTWKTENSFLPLSFTSLLCGTMVALRTCWVPLPWGLAQGCGNSAAVRCLLRNR